MKNKIYLFIFILLMPSFALALSSSSISVDVTPLNYGPNENVNISLQSFSANLDTVSIVWIASGKILSSGIGKKSVAVTTPSTGGEVRVVARISLPDGEIEKVILLRPNVISVLWQATDSYVPPFYKGKAMPTLESEIKVVALPEIKVGSANVNPKNLAYSWRRDYSNETQASGYGKNSFTYVGDYLDGVSNIQVTAGTTDGQYSSEGGITVGASSPSISFYRKDSELGIIWENSLKDGHRVEGEEVVIAAPYFISPKDIRRPELNFNWSINDQLLAVQNYLKNVMPLRAEAGTSGESRLRLQIENTSKIFQTVEKEIRLEF